MFPDWVAPATGLIGLAATLYIVWLTYRLIKHGVAQIEASRRSIEAGIAAEVRARNSACREERRRIIRSFPLHVDLVTMFGPHRWEVVVDGKPLGDVERGVAVRWLELHSHSAVRTWENIGDLTDQQLEDAAVVVGFLNDLCQMLSDGTPGHFIFQQYHQLILALGVLVLPLVQQRQSAGRWGVRLPSLINRAAIYHRVRPTHSRTTVKIRRPLDLQGFEHVPAPLARGRRVEILIPIVGLDGTTGSVRFDDISGREMIPPVDYEAFERHYRDWKPPDVFH